MKHIKLIREYGWRMVMPDDHMIVHGNDKYYQITFNHKQAFVKANDVVLTNE